ncbi:hypothetical protein NKG94_50870 [Micromonospora sp. M12]
MGFGLTSEFTTLFQDDDDPRPIVVDPVGLLRADRRRTLQAGLGAGLGLALVGGCVMSVVIGPVPGFGLGLAGGFAVSLATGFGAFGRLQMARLWWCTRGTLPWSMITFLDDAYHRGVLRQSGGVYQFRHALLRDRLATNFPSTETDIDDRAT